MPLEDVAVNAFGPGCVLVPGDKAISASVPPGSTKVAVFGKGWGKELRLPSRSHSGSGSYFVDWVLAKLSETNRLVEFVAVEVQSIDTTGNYRDERLAYLEEKEPELASTAGLNWENVNKRILPQLIYKGHVLRRERLCKKGLYFITPTPVYNKIRERLGGALYEYVQQSGAVTFMWYDIGPLPAGGDKRALVHCGSYTTTVDQIANAFTAPSNLPEANVYESAILQELG